MSSFTEAWLPGPSSTNKREPTKFYTRTWAAASQSPRAVVVFVHGFAEHIGRYEHVFPTYAQKDITVFAFDQRGFGRTAIGEDGHGTEYGKTSGAAQLKDIEWALKYARDTYGQGSKIPLFLMGHSMGGGLVLTTSTRSPPLEVVSWLTGVIASSPLVEQTKPVSKLTLWAGTLASKVLPGKLIPTALDPTDLSHDPEVGKKYLADPLVHLQGSLKGVSDMLLGGSRLLSHDYKHWPSSLPVIFLHGDADRTTSHDAVKQFCSKIPTQDKKFRSFPGGMHELMNEPDGVQEDFTNEVITWIDAHLSGKAPAAATTQVEKDHASAPDVVNEPIQTAATDPPIKDDHTTISPAPANTVETSQNTPSASAKL